MTERDDPYDPFSRGRFPVGVATIQAPDPTRGRALPCELWYPAAARHAGQDLAAATQDRFTPPGGTPRVQAAVRDAAAQPGTFALVAFSHSSGGHRRSATFLCTHLASHGYVVAALDHWEVVAEDLAPRAGETAAQRATRVDAWIANRVPDIRLLLDHLLGGGWPSPAAPDPARIGVVGHSFGGWTALAAPDVEGRIRAVVALAPAGSARPRPGIIPATLAFGWGRDVPTLYLVAERDTATPLAGMYELFDRTPAARQLVILRRADHLHFIDHVEAEHEAMRAMSLPGEAAWLPSAMPPIGELCSGEAALRGSCAPGGSGTDAVPPGRDPPAPSVGAAPAGRRPRSAPGRAGRRGNFAQALTVSRADGDEARVLPGQPGRSSAPRSPAGSAGPSRSRPAGNPGAISPAMLAPCPAAPRPSGAAAAAVRRGGVSPTRRAVSRYRQRRRLGAFVRAALRAECGLLGAEDHGCAEGQHAEQDQRWHGD